MVSQAECTRLSVVRVVQPALTPSAQEAKKKKSSPTSIRDSYPISSFGNAQQAWQEVWSDESIPNRSAAPASSIYSQSTVSSISSI